MPRFVDALTSLASAAQPDALPLPQHELHVLVDKQQSYRKVSLPRSPAQRLWVLQIA